MKVGLLGFGSTTRMCDDLIMAESIYWYDYETTGIDPARDRVLQFAGVRTDMDLNVISASGPILQAR